MPSNRERPATIRHYAALLIPMLVAAAPVQAAESFPACPASPVRVVHSAGEPTTYNGTYPGIPELCRLGSGGAQGYFYFGIWRMDWPGAGAAYPAMKTAINGPAGTPIAFVTRSYPGLQWTDTIINEGVEPLVINGQTYRTLKMAHEREGIEGNTYHSIITVWRDTQSGANIKVVENQISGQSYGPETTWTAVRIDPVLSTP